MNSDPEIQVETTATHPGNDLTPATTATIGVFDSGIGGFTVAGEILKLRPDVNLVYYGDSLNVPYGSKSPEQLARMAKHSIQFLKSQGADILAVGCNASNSVLGQGELKSFGLPVYDLVSSTIEYLKESTDKPDSLALVATEASINSGYWQRKLIEAFPELQILEITAPRFVPLVEDGCVDDDAIDAAIRQAMQICVDRGVTSILHGCTHYPLLQSAMQEFCADFNFIDPAVCLANKLVNHLTPTQDAVPDGSRQIYCSLPTEAFYRAGETSFGFPIRNLTSMYIVNPFED